MPKNTLKVQEIYQNHEEEEGGGGGGGDSNMQYTIKASPSIYNIIHMAALGTTTSLIICSTHSCWELASQSTLYNMYLCQSGKI